MGGGGALKTAAMHARFRAAAARGVTLAPPTEQSVRDVSRPVSAVVSMSQKAKAAEPASWEERNEDEVMGRMVFGGAPSFQEAKAATTEVKDVLDMIFLKSISSCEGSSPGSQTSVVSPFNTKLETKSFAIKAISNPSVPKHVLQAFELLKTSSKVQNVVASIISYPNVWDAIMQSPAMKDFFQSQQKDCAEVADFEVEGTHEKVRKLFDSDSGYSFAHENSGYSFAYFVGKLHNLMLTAAEMVSSMSNYLHNIFRSSMAEDSAAEADGNGNTKANFTDHSPKIGTLMGLVVLVVMVVVLKRV